MEFASSNDRFLASNVRDEDLSASSPINTILLLAACYLLAFGCIENFGGLNNPDRAVPEDLQFDAIALFKSGTRVISFGLIAIGICRCRKHPLYPPLMGLIIPLAIFALWSAITSVWSPMPGYSLGHALEFLLLLMIALLAALVCGNASQLRRLMGHACLILFLYLGFLIVMAIIDPQSARILRVNLETEAVLFGADADTSYLLNPPEIAGIAALGMILLTAARLMWGWRWTRISLLPCLLGGCALLFVIQSRSSIAVFVAMMACILIGWGHRWMLAAVVVLASLAGAAYLTIDPGFNALASTGQEVASYMSRGQSSNELRGLGGRMGHWTESVESMDMHPSSIFMGFGYSMATSTGKMWNGDALRRYTGHNILLDVFAGTGLPGFALFMIGLFVLVRKSLRCFWKSRDSVEGKGAYLVLLLLGYSLLMGTFGDSIVGALDPTSVVLFAVMGLGLRQMTLSGAGQ